MDTGAGHPLSDLVAFLEQHRAEILDAYQDVLAGAGSKIAADPEAMRQARANAEQILADVAESIGGPSPELDETGIVLARNIGSARAASGLHPRESLRAASLFFQSAVTILTSHVGADDESVQTFSQAVLALENCIAARIHESATAYTGFLLNSVHEAQLRERRRIARELHDRIGHSVSVAHRQLELYDLYRMKDPAKASARAETAQHAIQETMFNLRAVTSELHPNDPVRSLEKALLSQHRGERRRRHPA